MKIYIGTDHSAIEYRKKIIDYLTEKKYEVIDLGGNENPTNYAQIGIEVGTKVANDKDSLGIVLCGTGVGISIATNKVKGIRCALITNDNVARLVKEHNNANVIAFGARESNIEEILRQIDIFLNTKFEGGRHEERINYITNFEKSNKN